MSGVGSRKRSRILEKIMNVINQEGYEVYRLDKREIPDAFYINDKGKAVAIEVETNRVRSPIILNEFDETMTVQPKTEHGHEPEVYLRVKELRDKGLTMVKTKEKIKDEFDTDIAIGTIHNWDKNKSLPSKFIKSAKTKVKLRMNKNR